MAARSAIVAVVTRGLRPDVYVVTSSGLVPGRSHRDVALAAVEGGATAIQLRGKGLPDEELLALAGDLAARCRERGVLFLVNDRVDVAVAAEADGAHVGQGDDPAGARALLGPDRVLGVSVSTAGEAVAAERAGADYLGVTVWASRTKPEAAPVGVEGLRAVCAATHLPVVAIGGIDPSNAAEAIAAGASGVAVVSAVGAAADPVSATRALAEAVRRAKEGV